MKKTRTNSAIVSHWILANRARVSNPPDCADPGLHPDQRRDQVAKRPNTGRTAARASVEGSHLLHGFFGRLQPRSPALPAAASSHLENQPFPVRVLKWRSTKNWRNFETRHRVEIRIPACLRRTAKCTDPTGARPRVFEARSTPCTPHLRPGVGAHPRTAAVPAPTPSRALCLEAHQTTPRTLPKIN